MRRRIPRTGERLPVIGTGSAGIYGWDPAKEPALKADCRIVLDTLVYGGGSVIDTAADYGLAETGLGAIMAESGLRPKLFVATKVGANKMPPDRWPGAQDGPRDRAQQLVEMQRSHERLGIGRTDLLQLHDMYQADVDLGFMRDWQRAGKTRYIGITTMFDEAYDAIYATLVREKPDFLQIDLALDNRNAEDKLIPAAVEHGVAVIVNSPFGQNRLFKAVRGQPVPQWAHEFEATTWAQFFLKWILGNPAVTCVIPGTNKPGNMLDNLEAGRGPVPNAKQRAQMVRYIESLPSPPV